jgi:cytidylate kinase
MHKIIIAIDGYSGCGKSSTAKAVADELGYSYIDTGAMYRAVTLYMMQSYISLSNEKEVERVLKNIDIEFRPSEKKKGSETYLNGLNVEKELRGMAVSERVSEVSQIASVRHFLVSQQQKMGKKKGLVMDGRDIGTVVFPEAELKIFMSASLEERAKRRQQELLEKKQMVSLQEIAENLATRDRIDTSRTESPLRKAPDAIELDTSFITLEEQTDIVLRYAYEIILRNS